MIKTLKKRRVGKRFIDTPHRGFLNHAFFVIYLFFDSFNTFMETVNSPRYHRWKKKPNN